VTTRCTTKIGMKKIEPDSWPLDRPVNPRVGTPTQVIRDAIVRVGANLIRAVTWKTIVGAR
jgi:hypothetical protein